MVLSRRKFIHGAIAGATTTLLPGRVSAQDLSVDGILDTIDETRVTDFSQPRYRNTGWGMFPDALRTDEYKPYKILEIHMCGGASQWETFWMPEGFRESSSSSMIHEFSTAYQNLAWNNEECGPNTPEPNQTQLFGQDSRQNNVRWGAATQPLWRNDIFDRTRMVMQSHPVLPHGPAAALTLTGSTLGQIRFAGTGAAVQHRYFDLLPTTSPYSYILAVAGNAASIRNAENASKVGIHPSFAQPLIVQTGNAAFASYLDREGFIDPEDQLLELYYNQYRDLLRDPNTGEVVRSEETSAYGTAMRYLHDADALRSNFSDDALQFPTESRCVSVGGGFANFDNATRAQLSLASNLLYKGARHVAVMDVGVDGYDTHSGGPAHLQNSLGGVYNLCSVLSEIIARDDESASPSKIDLNDTVILINSEFGRTPNLGNTQGRDHWPYAYASIMIGGPIRERGIAGAIEPVTGNSYGEEPDSYFSPTDLRAAMLVAAGINPFTDATFRESQLTDSVQGGDDVSTIQNLRRTFFGVSS